MGSAVVTDDESSDRPALRVLLVEDVASDARLAQMALAESQIASFDVKRVASAAEMERELAAERYDALLLDLSLPDATGLMGFEKARKVAPVLPIVVLTALDDEEQALRATRCGAQDYLIKGSSSAWRLARTLRHAIERQRIVAALEDARNREHHQATHDALTGLSNRPVFHDLVRREIARARRGERTFAVLFVDLDRFKQVNDEEGHDTGDRLLRELGTRLLDVLRESDAAARLGGDEFLVLANDLARAEDAAPIARRIVEEIARPVDLSGRFLSVGASVGIAIYPDDDRTVEGLIRRADAAMYVAKSHGGNQLRFYTAEQHADAERRFSIQRDLRAAVRDRALVLHYQPRREIATGRVVALEALLRWPRDEGELLHQSAFLDEADRAGLLRPIGEWMLDAASAAARRWRSIAPKLRVAVSVSGQELRSLAFPTAVEQGLARSGLTPDAVDLEIAQSVFDAAWRERRATLEELASVGVRLWIDEFAVGPDSLAQVGSGLVGGLKVDPAFVRGLPDDPTGRGVVSAIAALAAERGLEIAADGVETEQQARALVELGCPCAVGPRLGRPVPADQVPDLLAP